MNKKYMMPETKVTVVKMNTMLMTSNPKAAIDPSQSVDADEVESRSFSLWDDEDEEE